MKIKVSTIDEVVPDRKLRQLNYKCKTLRFSLRPRE